MKYYENINSLHADFGVVPSHPLIDIQYFDRSKHEKAFESEPAAYDFYKISFVKNAAEFIQEAEHGEVHGVLFFTPPAQKYACSSVVAWQGFQLLIHADIYQSHLTEKNINAYTFFTQNTDEPLLLSEEETETAYALLKQAHQELHQKNDKFTVSIVLSYISILLNTCQRIATGQFESKHPQHNQLTTDFIKQLRLYYANHANAMNQPSVAYFATQLNVTPNHLSDVVRQCKGISALQMIHDYIVEEAKLLLLSSNKSVAEISYGLGFAYPSYFSRLFKKKTQLSPSEFRQSVKSI